MREYSKTHRAERAAWLNENAVQQKEYSKAYHVLHYSLHKQEYKDRASARRIEKHDEIIEYLRKSYRENREDRLRQSARWKKNNPEKLRIYSTNRRAREWGAEGEFTEIQFSMLCKFVDYTCLSCGDADSKMTVDHVVPISLEGSNYISNIQPLCRSCNSSKQDKIIDYRAPEIIAYISIVLMPMTKI